MYTESTICKLKEPEVQLSEVTFLLPARLEIFYEN